jgi:cytoplasmic iron level regulating protein YaaA (DUF328/UPF0246 family)
MIAILSPAKTLDFDSPLREGPSTEPRFVEESDRLIRKLRSLSKRKLSALMNLNKDLTELNAMRYQEWSPDFDPAYARPALHAFSGEVYRGLGASSLTNADLEYAQHHLRILSGLHGLLRPADRIRPYRLEMGTTLPVGRTKNLYGFWGEKITQALNEDLASSGTPVLVNLASAEYAKAIQMSKINAKVITPVFKEFKAGEYKVVMTYAKHARGAMARYLVKERIEHPEDLKDFDAYQYAEPLSSDTEWVFVRG